jgi:hypothetical protein
MTASTVATSDASTHAIATRGGGRGSDPAPAPDSDGDAARRPPMDLRGGAGREQAALRRHSGIEI